MGAEFFESLKRYVGFEAADAENLAKLAGLLAPSFARVVDRFYEEVFGDPEALRVFTEGYAQVERLRVTLTDWLRDLFGGHYGTEYYQRRCQIGHSHVRVGLPQYLMVTGMSVVRTELLGELARLELADEAGLRTSLNKILDLDLTIMIETYRVDAEERIRVAERNQMAQRLGEAEHLAELGKLAASLAHEIKNPLAGISGAIQILEKGLKPGDERREVIEEILRQIDRLDSAVKDLLVYARPTPPAPEYKNLGDILSRVLALLEKSPALRKVEVDCQGLEDHHYVHVDEGQMEQVFCNLILNACHASGRGGRLEISLTRDPEWCDIRIQDYGKGMNEEVFRRAFEPFFTTKAKGTGLGLPICRKIVEAHGGRIQLSSRLGEGTTVIVRLPTQPAAHAIPREQT